ncbi:MAG: RluA family pseudouridine synthase [Pseudomonadota bacterium]|nr:RluA family pseudouridine synthase [Pseudomonadota bacterium]
MEESSRIAEADDGIRLDRWFRRHRPQLTHALLEKYLRKGLIRLDGRKAKSSERVRAGQEIEVRIQDSGFRERDSKPKTRSVNPEDAQFIQDLVLYKDAHVIVINKPYGIPVQGGSKVARSIDGMLGGLTFDSKERPRLVHRLDRDTSGALLLARDAKTAAKLAGAFAGKDIDKTYWALVNGAPLPPLGVIDLKLAKAAEGKFGREQMQVDEEGKRAVTEYRTLDALARKFALLELKPLTGRTHQLRVHLAAIGCPILGDHKYGGASEDASAIGVENILHLHARRIVIPAAIAGKAVDVKAPLPEHMKRSFLALGLDIPRN